MADPEEVATGHRVMDTKIRLWDLNGTLRAELPASASVYPLDPDREPECGLLLIPRDSPALDVDKLRVTVEHYRDDGTLSHFWRSKPRGWVLDLDSGRIELPWINERADEIREAVVS